MYIENVYIYTFAKQVSGEPQQAFFEVFLQQVDRLLSVNRLLLRRPLRRPTLKQADGRRLWHARHPAQLVSVDRADSLQLVEDGEVGPVDGVATVHVAAHHEVVQAHPDQLSL